MSLSVSGYPQNYSHHSHHHQPHLYHNPHHQSLHTNSSTGPTSSALDISVGGNGGTGMSTAGGLSPPTAPPHHDFYSAYPSHNIISSHPSHHQMSARYHPYSHHMDHMRPDPASPPSASSSAAAVAAAVAASAGGYFPNWMLTPPPELSTVTGHIPDGFHSFGAPGSNSPGGTHYQSFIQYENGVPVRCVKRRVTANKKERRRTLSINNAFSQLRGCIPNVPSDTKLSKIKTLRLATSYISYLMDILAKDDPELSRCGFKAELTKKMVGSSNSNQTNPGLGSSSASSALVSGGGTCGMKSDHHQVCSSHGGSGRGILDRSEDSRKRESDGESEASSQGSSPCPEKKPKGRTGWPQHVWAAELK